MMRVIAIPAQATGGTHKEGSIRGMLSFKDVTT